MTSRSKYSDFTPLWVIFADGEFDQICEAQDDARREARDLKKMGCEVKTRKASSWAEAEAMSGSYC